MQTWQPTASKNNLIRRANILAEIRQFFAERNILEVETPSLSHHGITNPYIESLTCNIAPEKIAYLQTSPEYHMKRLLCAGMGSIYQMGKAFRRDEQGRLHNPEFTMLEWYRVGFDHRQLMDEVAALLSRILGEQPINYYSYQALFLQYLNIDPLATSAKELRHFAKQHQIQDPGLSDDRDEWLLYLFGCVIEPQLHNITFVDAFPASQAVLSRIDQNDPRICHRVEVYAQGMELANGFCELTDATEQRSRFIAEQEQRRILNRSEIDLDENFLHALEQGLPECSGIALGVDRLIMLALNANSISDVIAFPFDRA